MIRQYFRRFRSNRGRVDKNGKPIADHVVYRGVVVAEKRGNTIFLGHALINPDEPTFGRHGREMMNEIAERRLMSGRYSLPSAPHRHEIDAFLHAVIGVNLDGTDRLRIPRQLHDTYCDVILRAIKMTPVEKSGVSERHFAHQS